MEQAAVPRLRRPVRTALTALLVLCVLTAVAGLGTALYLRHRLTSQIGRIDHVFTGLTDRPPRSVEPGAARAVNILVMGTDRGADEQSPGAVATGPRWLPGSPRTEMVLVLHIDGDRRGAAAISIPRSSWVPVPGRGRDTIEAAFSDAGPALAVETVEDLTGVRIDHLAVIDWAAFGRLVDAAGGITVTVPETVRDSAHDSARDVAWTAGEHHLDGAGALDYVRRRDGLTGGELELVARQQDVLREVLESSLHAEMRHSPKQVYDFLSTLTRALSVEAEWSVTDMTGLMVSIRSLRTSDIAYLTVPVSGVGTEGRRRVVHLDHARGAGLWDAVRDDDLDDWLAGR